jgi:hypothetical protein
MLLKLADAGSSEKSVQHDLAKFVESISHEIPFTSSTIALRYIPSSLFVKPGVPLLKPGVPVLKLGPGQIIIDPSMSFMNPGQFSQ